jgi:hypothetical protein
LLEFCRKLYRMLSSFVRCYTKPFSLKLMGFFSLFLWIF